MKMLALVTTLALHFTGLWSHMPAHTRTSLTTAAVGSSALSASNPAASAASAATSTTTAAPFPAWPIRTTTDQPPRIPAASAFAVDTASGTVLYAQNAGARRPLASITKLVTIMVILSRHNPTEPVKIPTLPTYSSDDELLGLIPGETYTVRDLVQAALINSANDAADALARWDAGTTAKFAAEMNTKVADWGITGTHFSNPTGLQDTGNYTSAQSLAKIAQLALVSPLIRQTVSESSGVITSTSGRALNLSTTNDLLASGQFYGIKTGYTLAAGECFVGLTRIQDHDVITVVLGAGDRFGATEQLRTWIDQNYQWL
jgi:D-alanyl-D-alanine carboxypeptidase (penicillin-binding protein 5/6)